ncbi:MAG: ACT domain-containing protein [Kiritimatiellae bacterium]|nr:ACT domain-containing protein [Kiritimatiellia bacterium]
MKLEVLPHDFAVSTFDTDYILVKAPDLPRALAALRAAGAAEE